GLEALTAQASRVRADVANRFDDTRLGIMLQYSKNINDLAALFEQEGSGRKNWALTRRCYDLLAEARKKREIRNEYLANPDTAPTAHLRRFYQVVNALEKGDKGVRQLQSQLLDSFHNAEEACELLHTIDRIA